MSSFSGHFCQPRQLFFFFPQVLCDSSLFLSKFLISLVDISLLTRYSAVNLVLSKPKGFKGSSFRACTTVSQSYSLIKVCLISWHVLYQSHEFWLQMLFLAFSERPLMRISVCFLEFTRGLEGGFPFYFFLVPFGKYLVIHPSVIPQSRL